MPGAHQRRPRQSQFWRHEPSGVHFALLLRVRLTPKSSQDVIDGVTETDDGTAIKARVRARPENGAANTALIALVAKSIDVPKSSISLSAGGKSRTKQLRIITKSLDEAEGMMARLPVANTSLDSEQES